MVKKAEKELPPAREACIYRIIAGGPLCVRASGQWLKQGWIVDLSDVHDDMIRYLLEHKRIETADGEPVNKPLGIVARKEPCPCRQKE